jgi:hypothetical protein
MRQCLKAKEILSELVRQHSILIFSASQICLKAKEMPRETCPSAEPVEFRLLRNTAFKQKREKRVTADISILDFGFKETTRILATDFTDYADFLPRRSRRTL